MSELRRKNTRAAYECWQCDGTGRDSCGECGGGECSLCHGTGVCVSVRPPPRVVAQGTYARLMSKEIGDVMRAGMRDAGAFSREV
ncbi:MAG TPA: hypothetical protein VKE42_02530 [Candidatus Cybelea sp.]|nr:hypothetical protein [Candidatus Cybelea sp.]